MTPSWRSQRTEIDMQSELEQIDAKLKSYRATSEKEGRAAQWCRDNRDSDPFQMDGKRQAHLRVKEAADQEIARLEFERRCALPAGGSNDSGWKPAGAIFYGADG
jgi:hypothetical protein